MLRLKSEVLELRGIANRTKKDGNVFYLLNVENGEGMPNQLYCPNVEALPTGLTKGDNVVVEFLLKKYDNSEYLVVDKVQKVAQ